MKPSDRNFAVLCVVDFAGWLGLLTTIIGPFVAFAVLVHFLERTIQRRLAERFGWKSVMWTGWLGTPIHELSHVAMCVLFRHRVDEVALFEPDPVSGRLGFVRHSYRKGNWFEELGNVFIGIAPLIGGSLALLVLLKLFYPDAMPVAVTTVPVENVETTVERTFEIPAAISSVLSQVLQIQNFVTIKFWIFVYLVLCIGSHMAPSWSDYQGTTRGVIMIAFLIAVAVLILSLFIPDPARVYVDANTILSPLFALFAITSLLCVIATIVAELILRLFPQRYEVK